MTSKILKSVNHNDENKYVVFGQFYIFLLAFILGTFVKPIFPNFPSDILFKFVDVLFICGTILLAVKLAREGWDLAASGYTVLGVGWGVFFAAIDFQHLEIAGDVVTSPIYFFIPCMILISYYRPFPLWVKILNLWCIVPYLIAFIIFKSTPHQNEPDFSWLGIGFLSFHSVSLIWGIFFLVQYKKLNRQQPKA